MWSNQKTNPDKFQAICIGKKTHDNIESFQIGLSISNDIVSTKIYDKRDDFDFEIVNFPFRWWCSSFYILWK